MGVVGVTDEHPGDLTDDELAGQDVDPFEPIDGRVLVQLTHDEIQRLIQDLPVQRDRTEEDEVSLKEFTRALLVAEAGPPRPSGDWGYNETGPKS